MEQLTINQPGLPGLPLPPYGAAAQGPQARCICGALTPDGTPWPACPRCGLPMCPACEETAYADNVGNCLTCRPDEGIGDTCAYECRGVEWGGDAADADAPCTCGGDPGPYCKVDPALAGVATVDVRRVDFAAWMAGLPGRAETDPTRGPYLHPGTGPAGSYRAARGAVPWQPDDLPAEGLIRRMRGTETP